MRCPLLPNPSRRKCGTCASKSTYFLALCLVSGIALVGLAAKTWLIWIHRGSELSLLTFSPATTTNELEQLGIVLHPRHHIFRAPKTIFQEWNVSVGLRDPDGVTKQVYLVNNQFPGPTIEARSGDELAINVHNGLEHEGVSIHWHGLHLKNQNSADGAVGITQCPIPPGRNFTYRVKIGDEEHGTYWWHSHFQNQRSDGLFGGLVVHRPQEAVSDSDELGDEDLLQYDGEMLLMIGDWFHESWQSTLRWYTGFEHMGHEPVPSSLLINGKGRFDCSLAVPSRPMKCRPIERSEITLAPNSLSNRTRWRIINTGSIAGFSVKASDALLIPVEVDGGNQVEPVPGEAIGIVYPGERIDVLVQNSSTNQNRSGLFVSLDPENFKYTNPSLNPNQSFPIGETAVGENQDLADFPDFGHVLDLATLRPRFNVTTELDAQPHQTIAIYVKTQILAKFSNHPKGFINHTSWAPQMPPLISVNRESWNEDQLVPFIPSNRSAAPWVDVVINNLDEGSHPFHMHGHSFFVLSSYRSDDRQGWGSYNPFDNDTKPPSPLNLVSPVRKDTIRVPRRGYVVLRFYADNPGLWLLHCHMPVHAASGIAMALHVGPPEDESFDSGIQPMSMDLCGST